MILKTQTRHLSLHIFNHFSTLDTPCHHKITALLLHICDCILLRPTKTMSQIAGKLFLIPQWSVKIKIEEPSQTTCIKKTSEELATKYRLGTHLESNIELQALIDVLLDLSILDYSSLNLLVALLLGC